MRRVAIILVFIMYLIGSILMGITIASGNNSDGYIYLKVEKSKVKVNDEFWLKVYVKANRTIGASQFSILYNPSVIKIKEVKLSDINHNAIMQTKISSGYLECAIITVQGIKSGELLVIKAIGLKPGESKFGINLEEVVDVNGTPLDFSVSSPIQLSIYASSSSTSTSTATLPPTLTTETNTSQSTPSTSPYYTQKNTSSEKSTSSSTTSSESTLTLPGLPAQSKSSPAGHRDICGPGIIIVISLLSLIRYRTR